MTFRGYSIVMTVATICATVAWLVVLYNMDPFRSGLAALLYFCLTLGCALLGFFALIGVAIRRLVHKEELISRQVARAFRQGIFFTALCLTTLVFLAFDFFTWWMMLLIMLVFASIESVFLFAGKKRRA